MACSKHPDFKGIRVGKKAKECDECVAFAATVKAALPGGKEKRNWPKKDKSLPVPVVEAVDPSPLGEVFSDPVVESDVFKPVDESGMDEVL